MLIFYQILSFTELYASGFRSLNFNKVEYLVYIVEPKRVELYWKDEKGSSYLRFRKLQEVLMNEGREIEFIMNAGIFEPQFIPTGLHIENGKEMCPLNLKSGKGNFYLKPNGVFYVEAGGNKANILESNEYAEARIQPKLATQSGPLLLQGGKVHPKFNKDSASKLHRNGVGVDSEGKVVFVMTRFQKGNVVNLYEFAELFRHLKCKNALYLDGTISNMIVNPPEVIKSGNEFAAMLVVIKP